MEYRTADTSWHPRSRWKPGEIPDLPCLLGAESVSADPDPTRSAPEEDDWRPLLYAIIRSLAQHPVAKRALLEAIAPFDVPPPDDCRDDTRD